ncbi:MAG: AbrB/MazE/SpoVT family DNA-binding domain-containing protein [Candidatus Berkelbacteria bacterium]
MFDHKLFGTATIGEKGQIVIPVEARNLLDLKVGDKLLVVSGPGNHGLLIMKPDVIKKFAQKMNEKFEKLQFFADSASEEEII